MRELDTVRARSDNRGLCVIVRDNSPGLPIDHLEEMVTPGWTTKTTETPAAVAWAWRWSAHAVTRMGGSR
jgi:signal transduction histidine kinase